MPLDSFECICDYDPPEFYWQSEPKARKKYSCGECGRKILPGEKYERVFAKTDDWIYTPKTCSRCLDLRRWVQINLPCFCWAHGNMIEEAKETIDAACCHAPEETQGLRFGLGRKLVAIRRAKRKRNPN